MDRDRGRAPALDRLRRHAHRRRGHERARDLGHLRRDRGAYVALGVTLVLTLRAMSRRWRGRDGRTGRTVRPGRRRRRPTSPGSGRVSSANTVAVILWFCITCTPSSAAPTSGRASGACSRAAATGAAPARADRLGDRPGLGGQPRLADLRARGALDRLPAGVRGDHLHAVHPLRLAALGIVLRGAGFAFQHNARRAGGRASPQPCSGWPRSSRRSSWARWSARSPGRVPGRQRDGQLCGRAGSTRSRSSSVRSSWRPAPTSRPCSWSATPGGPRARPRAVLRHPRARDRSRDRGARSRRPRLPAPRCPLLFDRLTGEALPLVILSTALGSGCSFCSTAAPGVEHAHSAVGAVVAVIAAGQSPSSPLCRRS